VLKAGSTPAPYLSLAAAQEAGAVTLNYGLFINRVLSFLIVAFAVFLLVKGMNTLKRKPEEKPEEPPKPSEEILLLTDIRDALKNR
jgi:large conductance mechanosensitive channel